MLRIVMWSTCMVRRVAELLSDRQNMYTEVQRCCLITGASIWCRCRGVAG